MSLETEMKNLTNEVKELRAAIIDLLGPIAKQMSLPLTTDEESAVTEEKAEIKEESAKTDVSKPTKTTRKRTTNTNTKVEKEEKSEDSSNAEITHDSLIEAAKAAVSRDTSNRQKIKDALKEKGVTKVGDLKKEDLQSVLDLIESI